MEVEIPGLPPKKDGANSMWAKGAEVARLVTEGETIRTSTISPWYGLAAVRTKPGRAA